VNQVQRDHEHAQEGQVFGVEEGVSVDARVEQENQHGEERDETASEQPISQQPREEPAREKERVGDYVSA